jgi:hypothetical protein
VWAISYEAQRTVAVIAKDAISGRVVLFFNATVERISPTGYSQGFSVLRTIAIDVV